MIDVNGMGIGDHIWLKITDFINRTVESPGVGCTMVSQDGDPVVKLQDKGSMSQIMDMDVGL